MDLAIRAARVEDSGAISALVMRAFDTFIAPDLDAEGRATFAGDSAPEAFAQRLAGESEGAPVEPAGLVVGGLEMCGTHVKSLFVAPECRGRGIARRLPDQALAGRDGAEITVNSSPRAEAIHERLGFRPTGDWTVIDDLGHRPMAGRVWRAGLTGGSDGRVRRVGPMVDDARRAASASQEACLRVWIAADPWRIACLAAVASLGLPDGWIGAGFLRNLVWDRLHGRAAPTPLADIDVIYHDPGAGAAEESEVEACLRQLVPGAPWSARNQARMHRRNGDRPYRSTADAMAHWLETPTAVAARLGAEGRLELLAPLGLDDLLGLRVRPTPHARAGRMAAYRARLAAKEWERTWPRLARCES